VHDLCFAMHDLRCIVLRDLRVAINDLHLAPPAAQTRAASDDPHLRAEVTGVLDSAVKLQLGHLRAWAFADGNCWNALQPNPGACFDPRRTVMHGPVV